MDEYKFDAHKDFTRPHYAGGRVLRDRVNQERQERKTRAAKMRLIADKAFASGSISAEHYQEFLEQVDAYEQNQY